VNRLFQELEAGLVAQFAQVTSNVHLSAVTCSDKIQREFKFNNKCIYGKITQCRKSGERLTSVCNFLALLVSFCFTIESLPGVDPSLASSVTNALLSGQTFSTDTHSDDPRIAGDTAPPMRIGFNGEGDDCIRCFSNLRGVFKKLEEEEYHIHCGRRCGMKLTISLKSETIINFCSRYYAACDDVDIFGCYCIIDPARAHARLPVQFNPPASFTTAYGADKEFDIDEATYAECAAAILTSLVAYLEGGAKGTPYISALYFSVAEFWARELTSIASGTDMVKVFSNVKRDGVQRKTLQDRQYSGCLDDLLVRLSHAAPDTDGCPSALREIVAKYLNVDEDNLDIIQISVPTVDLDTFTNPSVFYTGDDPRYQIPPAVSLTDWIGDIDVPTCAPRPDDLAPETPIVVTEVQEVKATGSDVPSVPTPLPSISECVTRQGKVAPAETPPGLTLGTRAQNMANVTDDDIVLAECARNVSQEVSYKWEKGETVGVIAQQNHLCKRLVDFHDKCSSMMVAICNSKTRQGQPNRDVWTKIKTAVEQSKRGAHIAAWHKYFDNSVKFQATDNWKAMLRRQFGAYRIGINGRAVCVYLECPGVPIGTARDTSPHVTLCFFGSGKQLSGSKAHEYQSDDRVSATCMASLMATELLAELGKRPDLTEPSRGELKYLERTQDIEYDGLLHKGENGMRCIPPEHSPQACWEPSECLTQARDVFKKWSKVPLTNVSQPAASSAKKGPAKPTPHFGFWGATRKPNPPA
jgi:hypothetical protein